MAYATHRTGRLGVVPAANTHHLVVWNGHSTARVKVHMVMATPAPAAPVTTGMQVPLHVTKLTRTVVGTGAPVGGVPVPIRSVAAAVLPAGVVALAPGGTPALALTGLTEDVVPFGIGTINLEETVAGDEAVLYDVPEGLEPVVLQPFEGFTVKQGALNSGGAFHLLAWLSAV